MAALQKGIYKIEVFQSAYQSPLPSLLQHSFTSQLGYIAHDHFCSPYHSLSIQKRGLIHPYISRCLHIMPFDMQAIQHYHWWKDNGWDLQANPKVWQKENGEDCLKERSVGCAMARRHMGDRHCVFGKLYTVRYSYSVSSPFNPLSQFTVYWNRGGTTCSNDCHPSCDYIKHHVIVTFPTTFVPSTADMA